MAGKRDVVEALAAKTNMTQIAAETFLDALPGVLRDLAIEDEKGVVTLNNFARVELVWKDERQARNPRTGESVDVPAQWKLNLKSAASYQNSVVVVNEEDSESDSE